MTTLTRRDKTTLLTALGVSWLWETRHCRMIGLEVGFDHRGAGTPWERLRRADLIGACDIHPGRTGRIWTIEIKGTTADWSREDLDVGKWRWDLSWCRPVVLCWDAALAYRVKADLGEKPWSVAYPDADFRSLKWLGGGRRELPPPVVDGDHWRNVAMAIAGVHTSQFMPTFANAQRNPVPLPQRIAEKMESLRGNKEQLDFFLDRVD